MTRTVLLYTRATTRIRACTSQQHEQAHTHTTTRTTTRTTFESEQLQVKSVPPLQTPPIPSAPIQLLHRYTSLKTHIQIHHNTFNTPNAHPYAHMICSTYTLACEQSSYLHTPNARALSGDHICTQCRYLTLTWISLVTICSICMSIYGCCRGPPNSGDRDLYLQLPYSTNTATVVAHLQCIRS